MTGEVDEQKRVETIPFVLEDRLLSLFKCGPESFVHGVLESLDIFSFEAKMIKTSLNNFKVSEGSSNLFVGLVS